MIATTIEPEDHPAKLCSSHDVSPRLLQIPHRRIRLNFRVVSVRATSVGSRSMLEAP